MARRMWRRCAGRGSWLSVSRRRRAQAAVAGPVEHVEQHRVRHGEARRQRLGVGGHEPLEGGLAPGHEPLGGLLAHDLAPLLRVVARLGQRLLVLGHVLGRLHDHRALRGRSPARPARPAIWWNSRAVRWRGAGAVVLRQGREQHRADRHVDADAERVGAADDLEQAGLGQPLDEPPVLREHAGVVHARRRCARTARASCRTRWRSGSRRSARRCGPSPRGCRGWCSSAAGPARWPRPG